MVSPRSASGFCCCFPPHLTQLIAFQIIIHSFLQAWEKEPTDVKFESRPLRDAAQSSTPAQAHKRVFIFCGFGATCVRQEGGAALIKRGAVGFFSSSAVTCEATQAPSRVDASLCFNLVPSNRAACTRHVHVQHGKRRGLRARDARHRYAFFMNTEGVISPRRAPCVTLFVRAEPLAPS